MSSTNVNLKRRSTLIPFLTTTIGDYYVVRFDGEHSLTIRNRPVDALAFTLYTTGQIKNGLPSASQCIESISHIGSPILLGRNDALVKDMPLDDKATLETAVGKYYVLALHDKRELDAGRTFNQWEVWHIENAEIGGGKV